jgi:polyvinyl alcohol dehydrogenase (cytochrome)
MKFLTVVPVLMALALCAQPRSAYGQQAPAPPESPFVAFDRACGACHERGNSDKAPDRGVLRNMTAEAIYQAIGKGSAHASLMLTDQAKRSLAQFVSGRRMDIARIADASVMPNRCSANPPLADPSGGPMWNGWAANLANTRFQPAEGAGLSPTKVPRLKLKWSFGLPGANGVNSQPTIAGGRLFIAVDTGYLYALNAATGCVYWSYAADGAMRGAITIGPGSGGQALYFGDSKANVYAVSASTGKSIWKVSVDDHPLSRVTGGLQLYEGRLYVPVASLEDPSGSRDHYPCCTFRGSVVALDALTGRRIWKTYTIADPPRPRQKKPNGVQLWSGAGAGIWSAPTIDPSRRALYVGTGNGFTEPAPPTTDAVMAFDMDTGKVLWSVQALKGDAFVEECGQANLNCPTKIGPDWDFGDSPILRTLPTGRRILVAGQKSGDVWGYDPDQKGAVVWRATIADTTPTIAGQIVWGGAADDQQAYFGLNSGGVVALRLSDGKRMWLNPLTPPPARAKYHGEDAAVSMMPGVVFSSGWDGMLRALATDSGRVLWSFDMAQPYQTVNGVKAKGGSMATAGPVVAGGMVFTGSGYVSNGVEDGMPGNVLLAFSAE